VGDPFEAVIHSTTATTTSICFVNATSKRVKFICLFHRFSNSPFEFTYQCTQYINQSTLTSLPISISRTKYLFMTTFVQKTTSENVQTGVLKQEDGKKEAIHDNDN
jgi:hypothetical protein